MAHTLDNPTSGNNTIRVRTEHGSTRVWICEGVAEISDMVVNPQFRGKGEGRLLLRRAMQVAREHGCTKVVLHVEIDNTVAYKLYQSAGFRTRATEYHMEVESET